MSHQKVMHDIRLDTRVHIMWCSTVTIAFREMFILSNLLFV